MHILQIIFFVYLFVGAIFAICDAIYSKDFDSRGKDEAFGMSCFIMVLWLPLFLGLGIQEWFYQ